LAAASPSSNEIHIWDWRSQRLVRTLVKIKQGSSSLSASESVRFSPDGNLVVNCHRRAADETIIHIWNAHTAETVQTIPYSIRTGFCDAVSFSPDGKLLAWISQYSRGENLTLLDVKTWERVWGLRTAPFLPKVMAINPDGTLIALGGYTGGPGVSPEVQIVIIDLAKHETIKTIVAFLVSQNSLENDVERLAWNPDGVHLAVFAAVGMDYPEDKRRDAVRIFDVRSGELVASEKPVRYASGHALRYTGDGKFLIEGVFSPGMSNDIAPAHELLSVDGQPRRFPSVVRIWDGRHRDLLQEIPGEAGSAAVTADGRYLALGGNGMIFVYELH
jgi:WD40 repeat protein